MSTRLLCLTAGYGEGHNAAARGLVAACNDLLGAGAARVVDVFAPARPRVHPLSRKAYAGLINRTPWAWRAIYRWLDRSPHATRLFTVLGPEEQVLRQVLAQEKPEVVCSTYPLYGFMLQRLARRGVGRLPPHYAIVTDSITVNALWWRSGAAGWFVPNQDSADVMRAAGVPASRIRVSGFPVDPFFADQASRFAPPPLNEGCRPRVLYIINSGTHVAAETARQLLAREEWDVTCTVGHNEALRSELAAAAARRRRPATVLGWTEDLPGLLLTHHVVVSKAGGATTQEAIAARCPMIVNQIVPGQEEGNYELLKRYGIGGFGATPAAVIEVLRHAFANGAVRWRVWRAAVEQLARPDAAREIVHTILPAARASLSPVLP